MNVRKKFWGQIVILRMFLVVLVFSVITGFVFQLVKKKQYNSEMVNLKQQVKDTDVEINKLKKIKAEGKNDDLEYIARQRLNMVKSNETIYVDMGKGGN
ncbi:septation ring formation regulator EzrA [Romboutsia maritimum]|uniref:Septation ring formation regulator EzrA n=1 Tax=Romboutsia maritimum TaxID=2020948 RepID=A0A371ISX2_9FIRM|nr:septum formation initiator family protein [Romboutsia maritimum]RDY23588.1 septation ring formation regulator EzrA [Romboutsia maritimum]